MRILDYLSTLFAPDDTLSSSSKSSIIINICITIYVLPLYMYIYIYIYKHRHGHNTDTNVVNGLKNSSSYEPTGEKSLKIDEVYAEKIKVKVYVNQQNSAS